VPPRTLALIAYRVRPSSSGLTPARARRTTSEDGGGEPLHPLPDRFWVRGLSEGFGWPAGHRKPGSCAPARSEAPTSASDRGPCAQGAR